MIQLHGRLTERWNAEPLVVRVHSETGPFCARKDHEALLVKNLRESPPEFSLRLMSGEDRGGSEQQSDRICTLPPSLQHLAQGDILRISPRVGQVSVLYRRSSNFNAILVTERCNSYCIMCSQPPKDADDSYLIDAYLQAIPLMDRSTPELGITGGEPTLLGERLLDLIRACADHLPTTALHMLSNGRMLNYLSFCHEISKLNHPDFVIGIPLYSDIPASHDFVVQAQGAFDQTIRGFMNLERCGIRTELRIVLQRQTIPRLTQLATFIARNLPFVEHVALMGLEPIGFAKANLDAIWIDPADYQRELIQAVETLVRHRMNVSIYNHQMCTLERVLWPYSRQSISDWKNEFLEVCKLCAARSTCAGFFASSSLRRSARIRPLSPLELDSSVIHS